MNTPPSIVLFCWDMYVLLDCNCATRLICFAIIDNRDHLPPT